MRKCVNGGPGARTLSAARDEMARWLRGFRDVSRVLFPEEFAGPRPRTPSRKRSTSKIPGDGQARMTTRAERWL
jgi:hypothetical protein